MEYLQAISSWDGEGCLLNEVNEKAFLNQQDSVAQVLRAKGQRCRQLRSLAQILTCHSNFLRQLEGNGSSVRCSSRPFRTI
jgi:hypothetical protein